MKRVSKHLLIGLWVFIVISMMTNCTANHHNVLHYAGSDKLIKSAITLIFILLPLTVMNILIFKSKNLHWILKIMSSIISTPILTFIFLLISTQTTKTFIDLYVSSNFPRDKKVNDTLIVTHKSISHTHGTHHGLKLKLTQGGFMIYPVNETQYTKTEINDSIPINYYKNINGSIYK